MNLRIHRHLLGYDIKLLQTPDLDTFLKLDQGLFRQFNSSQDKLFPELKSRSDFQFCTQYSWVLEAGFFNAYLYCLYSSSSLLMSWSRKHIPIDMMLCLFMEASLCSFSVKVTKNIEVSGPVDEYQSKIVYTIYSHYVTSHNSYWKNWTNTPWYWWKDIRGIFVQLRRKITSSMKQYYSPGCTITSEKVNSDIFAFSYSTTWYHKF